LRIALFFAALLVGWATTYVSGMFPWLGYASWTRSSFGAGGLTIVGESKRGFDVGPDDFLFVEGQEIFIDYDVSITAGSLWFHVFQPFDGVLGEGQTHYVTTSGKGTWTMPVEKTAIYHITIEPSPTKGPGRGWDISYEVAWGARKRAAERMHAR
jgi:hypothetical protein